METGAIQKLGCSFLFAFYSDGVTLQTGLGFVRGHWKWHHLIDRVRVSIRLP